MSMTPSVTVRSAQDRAGRSGARPATRREQVRGAVASSALPDSATRWMYGYGMFHAASAATDSLILLFAAAFLSASPMSVGLLDAIGNVGIATGSFFLTLWLRRMSDPTAMLLRSILLVGVTLIVFSLVNNIMLALCLALVIGWLTAPAVALAPLVASMHARGAAQSNVFSYVNKATSLGAAVGIGLSVIWLNQAGKRSSYEMEVRVLFVLLGVAAIVGSLYSGYHLRKNRGSMGPLIQRSFGDVEQGQRLEAPLRRPHFPKMTDQMVLYLLSSFLMFVGVGLSYSGVHTYLTVNMAVPLALIMLAFLSMRMVSYFVSGPSGEGRAALLPVQLQSMAMFGRAGSIALLAVLGFLLPVNIAMPLVLAVIVFWGLSVGIVAVAGTQTAAKLSIPGYWGQSQALYIAAINVGYIAGAWLGGMLAGAFGFNAMFLIAAGVSALSAYALLKS